MRAHPPEESQAVRAMYRRIGLDPTKTRPSSEALLRRVRKGDRLPRINTLVDICNWCSLEFQLPYGLYDVSALQPPVTLRIGTEGESYPGIRKDAVNVADRLTLADQAARSATHFGSARTMVTVARRRLWRHLCPPSPSARLAPCSMSPRPGLLQFASGRQTLRAVI